MIKILAIFILIFSCSDNFGQDYNRFKSKRDHSGEIILIATSIDQFATAGEDKSVVVYDYNGTILYKFQAFDGDINSMSFVSNSLLLGITEMINGEFQRHIIKCLDSIGNVKYELVDTTLTQEYVDYIFSKNSTGIRNAIDGALNTWPGLGIKKELDAPQVVRGLSHVEMIQSIAVSPDANTIVSIDKFNTLKMWKSGKIHNSLQITNKKKDTEIYFLTDSTIFISPNIILNTNSMSYQVIQGFDKYSSIPFDEMIYFHFDYNAESRQEKLYNTKTAASIDFIQDKFYTLSATRSRESLALLGVDGLIRVIDKDGQLLSTFGRDRNELITFRGEKIKLFSKIIEIGFSPNGQYIISGDENGKVIIWKYKQV